MMSSGSFVVTGVTPLNLPGITRVSLDIPNRFILGRLLRIGLGCFSDKRKGKILVTLTLSPSFLSREFASILWSRQTKIISRNTRTCTQVLTSLYLLLFSDPVYCIAYFLFFYSVKELGGHIFMIEYIGQG